jgi:hypothetical protein
MRLSRRILSILVLVAPLMIVGCGGVGSGPPGGDVDMAGSGDGGLLALFAPCTASPQCASGLCTMTSYDRSPTPICTYQCDASNMNPNCPMGCNPKGYCKKPM